MLYALFFWLCLYKRLSKINHPMIKMYRFTNIHIHFFSHIYLRKHSRTHRHQRARRAGKKAHAENQPNESWNMLFPLTSMWHILCGFFFLCCLLLTHLSLFGITNEHNEHFKMFRVKTAINGRIIFIHGNASLSSLFPCRCCWNWIFVWVSNGHFLQFITCTITHIHSAYIHKYYYIFTHFEYILP